MFFLILTRNRKQLIYYREIREYVRIYLEFSAQTAYKNNLYSLGLMIKQALNFGTCYKDQKNVKPVGSLLWKEASQELRYTFLVPFYGLITIHFVKYQKSKIYPLHRNLLARGSWTVEITKLKSLINILALRVFHLFISQKLGQFSVMGFIMLLVYMTYIPYTKKYTVLARNCMKHPH